MMKKYNKKEIELKLQELEDELIVADLIESFDIGIVGGSSLILKGIKEREVTKDIDSIRIVEFKDNGISRDTVESTLKNISHELMGIINSNFAIFDSVLFVEMETDWELVYEGVNGIVKAYVPSDETIVAMKLTAVASKTKLRDTYYIDINSKHMLENANPEKIKELLDEYVTYISNQEDIKLLFKEYEEWSEKVKRHNESK